MNGPEKARRRLLNPRHRGRALIGSPGLNNEVPASSTGQATELAAEVTGAEKDFRIAEVAKEAGQHSVAHTVAPPVQQGSEEYHG